MHPVTAKRPVLWLAAASLLGLAGCLDIGLVSSIAFPPTIAGLDPAQPWVPLPVGSWVTEGRIEAQAIVGCFGCTPAAAVGLFRAEGEAGAKLLQIAGAPDALVSFLERGDAEARRKGRKPPNIVAAADRVREGAWTGFAIRMSRPDGSRPASGVALAHSSGGSVRLLIVVAASEDAARRIARDVAARQG